MKRWWSILQGLTLPAVSWVMELQVSAGVGRERQGAWPSGTLIPNASLDIKWKFQEGQLNRSWIFNKMEDEKNNQINYLLKIITQFYLRFITDSD